MKKMMKQIVLLMTLYMSLTVAALHASGMTVEELDKRGVKPMQDDDIKQLLIGNIIVVRNTDTLANYAARFDANGKRVLQQVSAQRDGPKIIYKTLGDAKDANIADYEVKHNRLITRFDNQTFQVMIFKVKDKYYGARSTDGGAIKWEIVLVTR